MRIEDRLGAARRPAGIRRRGGASADRPYDAVRNFNRDAEDALTRLLYPGWQSDFSRAEVRALARDLPP
jgi:hypothetical protein